MCPTSPVEALTASLYSAVFVDLPLVSYETVDFEAMAGWTPTQRRDAVKREGQGKPGRPMKQAQRRPSAEDCRVRAMFPQTWASQALGFGGLGSAAMTVAYTVVVEGPGNDNAVYWQGELAYLVPAVGPSEAQRAAFQADLHAFWVVRRSEAADRYGAVVI